MPDLLQHVCVEFFFDKHSDRNAWGGLYLLLFCYDNTLMKTYTKPIDPKKRQK